MRPESQSNHPRLPTVFRLHTDHREKGWHIAVLALQRTGPDRVELDTQAPEQIPIGHLMAIAGEANQIFRPVTMFDHGIDGEVEFKDNDGKASGRLWNEHQRCANKPAQGNALGIAFENGKAPKGRHKLSRPFRARIVIDERPRALPWAGLLPGLWP